MINVYARKLGGGWLFEDLKRHIATVGAAPSEEPLPGADAYICIRSQELAASPDPARTVVQIHSLAWQHHVDYDLLRRVGGIVATHPEQLERARVCGVDVDAKAVLLRPIGALDCFALRESMPETFTAGWVGRPIRWQGRDIKRLHLYVEAVLEIHRWGIPIRAMLVGERLHEAAGVLLQAGVEVAHYPRETTPIEDYPALYHQMDVCVATTEREPGPLCIYEALACGVPVVGTLDGQAHHRDLWGLNVTLTHPTPSAIAADLRAVAAARDRCWFAGRYAFSASTPYRLEDWAAENVALARGLTA